ncbi:putative cytosolic protein [Lunatimonas lonarensis]|uniref:Putative cytosolic protein n=2 Tax=Lunatimonas lonarensis TaxID=1232681 RepID=R7ZTT0_9BACT|nr:putative cytosolic protein [Lunatimonas lonarensis]
MVVGVVYGESEEISSHYRRIGNTYPVIIGKDFWHRLTGKDDFYFELIDAIGEVALEVDGSKVVEQTIKTLAVEIVEKYK